MCRRMLGVRSAMLTRSASTEPGRNMASWPHTALKEAIACSQDLQQTATADPQTIHCVAAANAAASTCDSNELEASEYCQVVH